MDVHRGGQTRVVYLSPQYRVKPNQPSPLMVDGETVRQEPKVLLDELQTSF